MLFKLKLIIIDKNKRIRRKYSCITNRQLAIEFKDILNNIRDGIQKVIPDKLKNVMS